MAFKQTFTYLIILLSFLSYSYLSGNGIKTANGGGHYALARTLVFDSTLEVSKYFGVYVHKPDYAEKDGKIYSDRLPGNAFLLTGYLVLSKSLSVIGFDELDIPVSLLLPAISGALSLLCFIFILNLLNFKHKTILISTILLGFGTLLHHESTHLFSHAASCLFVTLSFLLSLLLAKQKVKKISKVVLLGFVLGFSLLIELQNVLFAIPIVLYLIKPKDLLGKENFKLIVLAGFPILVSIAVLLFYNYSAFGELLLKSNTYNPFFPEEKTFMTALSGNVFDGLDRLLFSFQFPETYFNWFLGVTNDTPGIFIASPVYLLAIPGYVLLYQKDKKLFLLLIGFLAICIFIAAFHVTTLVRHIATIYVLLFLPFAYFLSFVFKQKGIKKGLLMGMVFTVFILSACKEWYINAHYWGRNYTLLEFPYFENYLVLVFIGFLLLMGLGVVLKLLISFVNEKMVK